MEVLYVKYPGSKLSKDAFCGLSLLAAPASPGMEAAATRRLVWCSMRRAGLVGPPSFVSHEREAPAERNAKAAGFVPTGTAGEESASNHDSFKR